jgi:hypothetical protein
MVLVSAGVAPAWSLVFIAGVLLAALLFERREYRPVADSHSATSGQR